MPQQIKRQRLRIRRNVKRLRIANPRQWAGRHIPHRISAGFPRGDPHRRQPTEHIRCVVDAYKMKLNVLPGGDMADGVGIFFRQLRQNDHLLRIHSPIGNLDPLHPRRFPVRIRPLGQRAVRQLLRLGPIMPLPIVIPLPIRPAPQARLGENLVFDFPLLPKRDLRLKQVDLFPHPAGTRLPSFSFQFCDAMGR